MKKIYLIASMSFGTISLFAENTARGEKIINLRQKTEMIRNDSQDSKLKESTTEPQPTRSPVIRNRSRTLIAGTVAGVISLLVMKKLSE
jgi:hypothetical protein